LACPWFRPNFHRNPVLEGSAIIVAALALAVGFAAQDVLSNFAAGVFIVQDRKFTIDDWAE
jgi:small-conductance mechanosensitive channel